MPYTVAILADIHGNLAALEAVLADVANHAYDALVLAGDLLANGPWPAETLARIHTLHAQALYGNMDEFIVKATPGDSITWWARQQIGEAGVELLAALPFSRRITPPGGVSPRDDLVVVHATPRSVHETLILKPEPNTTTFTTVTPADEAAAMIAGVAANLIVYGHIHYFSTGTIHGQRLASIGSVGFPFDGDQRAAYALVHWDGADWTVTSCRVRYDFQSVVEAIRHSGQPFAERYAQMILQAKWLTREVYS